MSFDNGLGGFQPNYNLGFDNRYRMPSQMSGQNDDSIYGITIVDGIESARKCQTPVGRVMLMDANNPMFYIKTTNKLGNSFVESYEFRKVEPAPEPQYVTVSEFNSLQNQIKEQYESLVKQLTKQQVSDTQPVAIKQSTEPANDGW